MRKKTNFERFIRNVHKRISQSKKPTRSGKIKGNEPKAKEPSSKLLHRVDDIKWPDTIEDTTSKLQDFDRDTDEDEAYYGIVRLIKKPELPENVYAGTIDWIDSSDGLLKTNEILMIEGSLTK